MINLQNTIKTISCIYMLLVGMTLSTQTQAQIDEPYLMRICSLPVDGELSNLFEIKDTDGTIYKIEFISACDPKPGLLGIYGMFGRPERPLQKCSISPFQFKHARWSVLQDYKHQIFSADEVSYASVATKDLLDHLFQLAKSKKQEMHPLNIDLNKAYWSESSSNLRPFTNNLDLLELADGVLSQENMIQLFAELEIQCVFRGVGDLGEKPQPMSMFEVIKSDHTFDVYNKVAEDTFKINGLWMEDLELYDQDKDCRLKYTGFLFELNVPGIGECFITNMHPRVESDWKVRGIKRDECRREEFFGKSIKDYTDACELYRHVEKTYKEHDELDALGVFIFSSNYVLKIGKHNTINSSIQKSFFLGDALKEFKKPILSIS